MKRKDSSLHSSCVTKCSTYADSIESESLEYRIEEDNDSENSNIVIPKINLTQSREAFVKSLTQSIPPNQNLIEEEEVTESH